MAAMPVAVAAALSLVGEGKALMTKEFRTLTGVLRITIAVKIERIEKEAIEWQKGS